MFNAMTMMSLYFPRALEEIVKLGGNPLLEEIIQRLSLIYKETEEVVVPAQRKNLGDITV